MRARWILGPAAVAALCIGMAFSPAEAESTSSAEATYFAEMHAAGLYDDQQSREFAQAMCLVDTEAKAEAAILKVLGDHPTAGHVFGIAAGFGVRAYCPDKADLWVQAGDNLAGKS